MCILSISSVLLENPAYFSGDSQLRWLSWAQSCDAQLALRDSVGDYVFFARDRREKGRFFPDGQYLTCSVACNHILSTGQGRG